MPETRYVRSLSKAEEQALRELYRQTQNAEIRTRCQMILLSAQEHAVADLATSEEMQSTHLAQA